jgi:hypothetical protein
MALFLLQFWGQKLLALLARINYFAHALILCADKRVIFLFLWFLILRLFLKQTALQYRGTRTDGLLLHGD